MRAAARLLDDLGDTHHSLPMDTKPPGRKPSKSAPFSPRRGPDSARERILLALELGRRGQMLRKLGAEALARSNADDQPGDGAP
jgi:hypothetical protein